MRGLPDIAIPDETRKQAVASIRKYFSAEMDLDVGDLKAGLLLDYFLKEIGPSIYNLAIADARSFFEERASDLDAVHHRAEFPYWAGTGRRS